MKPRQSELPLDLIEGTPHFFQYQTSYECAAGPWHHKCSGVKCDCRCHFEVLSNHTWRRLSMAKVEAARAEAFLDSVRDSESSREAQGKGKTMARKPQFDFGF